MCFRYWIYIYLTWCCPLYHPFPLSALHLSHPLSFYVHVYYLSSSHSPSLSSSLSFFFTHLTPFPPQKGVLSCNPPPPRINLNSHQWHEPDQCNPTVFYHCRGESRVGKQVISSELNSLTNGNGQREIDKLSSDWKSQLCESATVERM